MLKQPAGVDSTRTLDSGTLGPVRAAVQRGDRLVGIEEFDLPVDLPADHALLRIEANGLCGTDYEQYVGTLNDAPFVHLPCVPGHEPVGRIVWAGENFISDNVSVGDRVAVETTAPCGNCVDCRNGYVRSCKGAFVYGFTSLEMAHPLSGGLAEYMVLVPNSVLHPVPVNVSAEAASLANALGAGFDWVAAGAVPKGGSVLVMGAGQRGIACAVAAAAAGAKIVIITGLERDRPKLDVALVVGATHAIIADRQDVVAEVEKIVGPAGIDTVVDVTPVATEPVLQAVEVLRKRGTLVMGGLKGRTRTVPLVPDKIVTGVLTVRGVSGTQTTGYAAAMKELSARGEVLSAMLTHRVGLNEIQHGLELLGGEINGEAPIHITVVPD